MKKKGVSKAILTMLLIAGMCIPVPAAYAAEVPSETGVVIETEMESDQEELTDEDQAADGETQAETETEAVTETETEAVAETETEAVTETETEAAAETESEITEDAEPETETEADTEIPAETDTAAETESEVETETEEVLLEASEADKPADIKNLKATATNDTVTLSWDASNKATGYIIYAYDKKTKKRTKICNTLKETHTFTGLTAGTEYSYVLIPFNKSVSPIAYGNVSEPVSVVPGRPGDIPSVSIKSGNKAVTLSWKAAENAVGYKIFAYDKKTKAVTAIVSTRNLSYTIKDLENGTEYSYRIRPYNKPDTKAIFGNYSKIVSAVAGMPGNVKTVTAKAGNGKAVLSWSAAENATGYRIFSYDPETGKLEGIKSVTGRTCTVTGLTNGQEYSFKIRPYNNSGEKLVCGAYSKAAAVLPGRPGPITDLKAQSAGTEVFLTWTAEETASYYQVFQYDFSTKKWKNIKRVTDSNAMITGLPTKTACRFRVLAYNRVNDKLLYTGSNIVNVTTGGTLTGWVTIGSDKYYYKNGARLKKYQQINGKYYYFDETTGKMLTGWKYVYGFKLYFDPKTGARWNDVESLIGKRSSYVIKVNCQANVVNIYAKDGDNGYVIPVKAFVCTTGASSTPTVKGTFYTPDKWRWQVLMGPSYGQWVTQIYRGYYFHSVFYNNYNDNNSLAVGAYNNLGKSGSHGCVRLTAGDAKWIYDNCSLGTKVITYSDSTPGPLGKPSSYKLPSWHTWDPTDPNMKNKCKQRGCH